MASTLPSNIDVNLAEDINCLALSIMKLMDWDFTIEMQARTVAQFMLLNKKIPLDECLRLFEQNPNARTYFEKLLDSQSEFLGPTPRSVGIDLVGCVSADKLQQSLDIKHVKQRQQQQQQQQPSTSSSSNDISNEFQKLDRIRPTVKIDLAHTHPTNIWVRFYCTMDMRDFNAKALLRQKYNILSVCENVYEAYGNKNLEDVSALVRELESNWCADIIFISELTALLYNPLLFLSNYIKFQWCYTLNRPIFDPQSARDIHVLATYTTFGMLFIKSNNLANMPKNTHGPLIACTGERPKIAISKFDRERVYVNEGSRALQTLNKASDFGTKSNFIEIISTIELDDKVLDNII